GSAVAAVPTQTPNYAYISSGTWSLVGLELDEPILTKAAFAANVTNAGGVYGTTRLLKNVMGLWILQQCRTTWANAGVKHSYEELVAMAERVNGETAPTPSRGQAVINPNDPRFLAPGNHPQHIRELCQQTGQPIPQTKGEVVRVVLQSLAMAYRDVLRELAPASSRETAVSNQPVDIIHILGGGTQNKLLNQMTANATGLPVIAGPIEATVIGNALVQLIALGEIGNIQDGRQIVAQMANQKRYEPN
ncbi:MAG: rhamnulokinase, partial [Methylococcales bacterium]|nr:rhamnulokinase [Methylococcales bacterium]